VFLQGVSADGSQWQETERDAALDLHSHGRWAGVVTPRDVLDLITKAKQQQQDEFNAAVAGENVMAYRPESHSARARGAFKAEERHIYLKAEFPHLWVHY